MASAGMGGTPVVEINQDLLAVLPVREVSQLDQDLVTLQQRADDMVLAHAELPKADRRRGGRLRRVMG